MHACMHARPSHTWKTGTHGYMHAYVDICQNAWVHTRGYYLQTGRKQVCSVMCVQIAEVPYGDGVTCTYTSTQCTDTIHVRQNPDRRHRFTSRYVSIHIWNYPFYIPIRCIYLTSFGVYLPVPIRQPISYHIYWLAMVRSRVVLRACVDA